MMAMRSAAVLISPSVGIGGVSPAAAVGIVEVLGYRVRATCAQGLAAQQSPSGQQAAAPRTEADDGNPCIIGATGVKATTLTQQRAEPALVEAEQKKQESGHDHSRWRNSSGIGAVQVFQKRACWCRTLGL